MNPQDTRKILLLVPAIAGLVTSIVLASCGGPTPSESQARDPDPQDNPGPQANLVDERGGKVRASLTGELPPDVAGVLFNLYQPADPANPNPLTDSLITSELVAPIDPAWPLVEFDAVVPAGYYYLEAIALDASGDPSPSCERVFSQVVPVGAHEQTEIEMSMVCSGGQNGYFVAGVDFTTTTVMITDIHQIRHWNYVCGPAEIVITAVDTLGGAVAVRCEMTGFPAQDPGSYVTLEDHGDGTATLSAKTPGTYPIRIWAESLEGHGYDWMDVTVVFLPDDTCERLEAACGQAVTVDLTQDESLPFDRYVCPDRTIEAPDVERALTFGGCGDAVTLVSSDPAQMLVVLEETYAHGAWSGSCVAYATSGVGEVTLDTEPGARYVLMVERAGLGTSTQITRLGCCL